jgi:hypothetical protein
MLAKLLPVVPSFSYRPWTIISAAVKVSLDRIALPLRLICSPKASLLDKIRRTSSNIFSYFRLGGPSLAGTLNLVLSLFSALPWLPLIKIKIWQTIEFVESKVAESILFGFRFHRTMRRLRISNHGHLSLEKLPEASMRSVYSSSSYTNADKCSHSFI